MGKKIEVRWEVEDGYVGKSRTQYTEIDVEDLLASCADREEADNYIQESVREDFDNCISFTMHNLDECLDQFEEMKNSEESRCNCGEDHRPGKGAEGGCA